MTDRPQDAAILSASEVARLLGWRKQDVLDGIASGRIPSVVDPRGKKVVPTWLLLEWQRSWPRTGEAA